MDNEGTLSLRQLVEAVTAEAMWRQEERLRALEARVDSLEEAIQKALGTVFPRVDALVTQLEKRGYSQARGCSFSSESVLSDRLARVSISSVRPEDCTRSVPVESASNGASSGPPNANSPAFDSHVSPSQPCASTHPPVSTSACAVRSTSRSSSPIVQATRGTTLDLSRPPFAFAPHTSGNIASSSSLLSSPLAPASTISSSTAVASSTRFSFSSSTSCSPTFSHPSVNSSFNPIVCSSRSPLASRVVSSNQTDHSASSETTTIASSPCTTHTWRCFHSYPSLASGGSCQLTPAPDISNSDTFQTLRPMISPSSGVLHEPSSASASSSSQQVSGDAPTRTPIAFSHRAGAPFASTPLPSFPSAVPNYANVSPSDIYNHSYSSPFPSTTTSSNPSVFSVPNVFGLSCVPSAWR